jgi:hypothetical protein
MENTEQIISPFSTIQQFFHHYTLLECRQLLREVLHQALSGYSNRDGMNPADLLRFLEELERVMEAVYTLGQQHKDNS